MFYILIHKYYRTISIANKIYQNQKIPLVSKIGQFNSWDNKWMIKKQNEHQLFTQENRKRIFMSKSQEDINEPLSNQQLQYHKSFQQSNQLKQADFEVIQSQDTFLVQMIITLTQQYKFNKLSAQINSLQVQKKSLKLELKHELDLMDVNDIVLEKRIVKFRKQNKDKLDSQIKHESNEIYIHTYSKVDIATNFQVRSQG